MLRGAGQRLAQQIVAATHALQPQQFSQQLQHNTLQHLECRLLDTSAGWPLAGARGGAVATTSLPSPLARAFSADARTANTRSRKKIADSGMYWVRVLLFAVLATLCLRFLPPDQKHPPTKKNTQKKQKGAVVLGMLGVSYASVPLYRMFCQATGYGGAVRQGHSIEEKLKRRQEADGGGDNKGLEARAAAREIRVWLTADVADDMPWRFEPTQEYVRVRPGESALAFFRAENKR